MSEGQGYVLGQSKRAARRLEIQDAHFADISERLLDDLNLRPTDRVVELGCGPGGFSRRVLARLGEGGTLVGVDCTEGLLEQAHKLLAGPPTPQPPPPRGETKAEVSPVPAASAATGAGRDG